MASSTLGQELVFGGGAALAALHLHHRTSEDLDFFATRPIEPTELAPFAQALRTAATSPRIEVIGPRTSLVLERRRREVARIDFAYYPFDPVGRRTTWRGLRVESIEDMAVNKLQAVLSRNQPRDFVDLYFLLREGPLRDLDSLLQLVRAKFESGPDSLGLAARLLLVHEAKVLPRMIRAVTVGELTAFFEERVRELVRRG